MPIFILSTLCKQDVFFFSFKLPTITCQFFSQLLVGQIDKSTSAKGDDRGTFDSFPKHTGGVYH